MSVRCRAIRLSPLTAPGTVPERSFPHIQLKIALNRDRIRHWFDPAYETLNSDAITGLNTKTAEIAFCDTSPFNEPIFLIG
jgi:hypothetical protein